MRLFLTLKLFLCSKSCLENQADINWKVNRIVVRWHHSKDTGACSSRISCTAHQVIQLMHPWWKMAELVEKRKVDTCFQKRPPVCRRPSAIQNRRWPWKCKVKLALTSKAKKASNWYMERKLQKIQHHANSWSWRSAKCMFKYPS